MPAVSVQKDSADLLGVLYNVDAGEIKRDLEDKIRLLESTDGNLVSALTHPSVPQRAARSQKPEWIESQILPRVAAAALGATAGSASITSIPVAAGYGAYFRTDDLVRNEATGEIFQVVSVATDTLTVVRGIGNGGVGIIFVAISDVLCRVANAAQEGSDTSAIRMTRSVGNYNYCQIIKNALGHTETLKASDLYGGNEPAKELRKKALEHKRDREQAWFVGKRDIKTAGLDHTQAYLGGVMSYIESGAPANVTTIGAVNFTPRLFEDALRPIFRYGSGKRIAFASPFFWAAVSSWSAQKVALGKWEAGEAYGVSTKKFITGAGDELHMVLKRDWQDLPMVSPGMGGTCVILDLEDGDVCRRPLRKTKINTNAQGNGQDKQVQELLTEESLEVRFAVKHGIVRGVQQYA